MRGRSDPKLRPSVKVPSSGPDTPASRSDQSSSSLTVYRAKNSGVVRFEVSSHAVALIPFSHASTEWGDRRHAQERLTHVKPSCLFCRRIALGPAIPACSCARIDTDCLGRSPPSGRDVDGIGSVLVCPLASPRRDYRGWSVLKSVGSGCVVEGRLSDTRVKQVAYGRERR